MSLLIGLHGKARSGKDTFAHLLISCRPFVRMAFADPLKEAVANLFMIPMDQAFSGDKDQVLPFWGLTLRDVLQRFGTEAMRDTFGHDFWVNRWEIEYNERIDFNVIITDVRFPNEADRIRALGGTVVHLTRPGAGLSGASGAHASERGLPYEPGDYSISNDGTLGDLQDKAIALVDALTAK